LARRFSVALSQKDKHYTRHSGRLTILRVFSILGPYYRDLMNLYI
jgi:hypothetical protein